MIDLEHLARSILMPTQSAEEEVHVLRAENAKLKQENARRRLKLRQIEQELIDLKESI